MKIATTLLSPRFDNDDQSFVRDVSRVLSDLHDAPNHVFRQANLHAVTPKDQATRYHTA